MHDRKKCQLKVQFVGVNQDKIQMRSSAVKKGKLKMLLSLTSGDNVIIF